MAEAPPPPMLDSSHWAAIVAAIVAAIAVVLSQVPPVITWFKRSRLDFELYPRISISHKVGNPNAQLHITVSNTGGRSLRVKAMSVSFKRDNKPVFELPLQNFLKEKNDKSTALFTQFRLKPSDEWSHIANFLNIFDRVDEQTYRDMESKIRSDIRDKMILRKSDSVQSSGWIEADPEFVGPILDFFEKKFDWLAGEYEISVVVTADKANCERHYRFTIFESQSEELKALSEHYKLGAGIFWDHPDVLSSFVLDFHEIDT